MNDLQPFEDLLKLLALERQADYEYFKNKVQHQPLEKRRAEGFTWFPLNIVRTGFFYGDRAFVTVERTTEIDAPHQFRSGNVVNLFTKAADAYKPERSGVIQDIDKNKMRIILNSKDLPDWLNAGQIGVDLLFDERTYIEMERALRQVMAAQGDRLAELRNIFLGKQAPHFRAVAPDTPPLRLPLLNDSQNAAVTSIVRANDVAIVHGPPGTGKTTTLVHAVRELCKTENTVLVTAPSNTAADLLTERLAELGLQVVRIGNISRVEENILKHTLEGQISTHAESKNIKKIRIQAAQLRQQSRTYKRRFDGEARRKREKLKQEARELSAWANDLEERVIEQILSGANVITCTLINANHPILANRKFRTVVIDEAAQALEPATWIPIMKASRVVLAGDPFQLPPTVKSVEAAKGGLSMTLIEKSIILFQNINLLNVQYRSNNTIMNFSNKYFYNNQLSAHPSVAARLLPFSEDEKSVTFIDTVGCGFDEQENAETLSKYNQEEFYILREHLYQLIEKFDYANLIEKPSIGIISPYREQVELMKNELLTDDLLRGANLDLTISTIDGFQGQERDVIYISLVRSNEKNEIGFLGDTRRMNVAMTRAKMKLVIIGNSTTIGEHRFYKAFLDYCEAKGTYKTAWEFMAS